MNPETLPDINQFYKSAGTGSSLWIFPCLRHETMVKEGFRNVKQEALIRESRGSV
jgi:hypothetical protein